MAWHKPVSRDFSITDPLNPENLDKSSPQFNISLYTLITMRFLLNDCNDHSHAHQYDEWYYKLLSLFRESSPYLDTEEKTRIMAKIEETGREVNEYLKIKKILIANKYAKVSYEGSAYRLLSELEMIIRGTKFLAKAMIQSKEKGGMPWAMV